MRYEQMIALAGEYVLGLLSASEAAAAEARMETDPAFRSAVADWRDHLVDLNEVTESIQPSADLWTRISKDLKAVRDRATVAMPMNSPPAVDSNSQAPVAEAAGFSSPPQGDKSSS
ncbi:hypothetical protein [Ensifer aridi]|uniref:hypothetical protein n=1 Tax=Ensifer aridi TaxID=1708715 RepID=UPI0003FB5206|nr:hypothetical protein [Ensifer aridi]